MSGVHKHPTISFRVSDREREMIEAKILASGMQKKDYFVRSCIYNRICVVGKKEVIYQLVEELQNMQTNLSELVKQLEQQEITLTADGLEDMRNDCISNLKKYIKRFLEQKKYLQMHSIGCLKQLKIVIILVFRDLLLLGSHL